jgi:hypothetical protein
MITASLWDIIAHFGRFIIEMTFHVIRQMDNNNHFRVFIERSYIFSVKSSLSAGIKRQGRLSTFERLLMPGSRSESLARFLGCDRSCGSALQASSCIYPKYQFWQKTKSNSLADSCITSTSTSTSVLCSSTEVCAARRTSFQLEPSETLSNSAAFVAKTPSGPIHGLTIRFLFVLICFCGFFQSFSFDIRLKFKFLLILEIVAQVSQE